MTVILTDGVIERFVVLLFPPNHTKDWFLLNRIVGTGYYLGETTWQTRA